MCAMCVCVYDGPITKNRITFVHDTMYRPLPTYNNNYGSRCVSASMDNEIPKQ